MKKPHIPGSATGSRAPGLLLVPSGILAFALYIAMDLGVSRRYPGYSYRDHTISELSAVGAPTRRMWLFLSVFYEALLVVSAAGTLRVADNQTRARIVGWLLSMSAAVGVLWWMAPMHRREVLADGGGDWRDTMHLALGGVTSVLFFATIGAGSFAFGRLFRWYSYITVVMLMVFGGLTGRMAPKVSKNEPTPWLGITERIAVEGAMLWQAVFAAALVSKLANVRNNAGRE